MIDENILRSLKDFSAWFQQYNQNKKDQQDFGVRNMPARVFRKTIDLSTAGVLQNTGIPFNGLHIEKVYLTATGASVEGSINLIFDRAMSDSQFNYKTLKENDSFTTGFSVAKGFLSWSAQAGVSIDIVFFNDIDYRSGSQKTSIVGTISVANTSATPMYNRLPIPVQITRLYGATASGTQSRVIPAGRMGIVKGFLNANNTTTSDITIGGVTAIIMNTTTGMKYLPENLVVLAGETASITVGAACDGYLEIEEYSIV